MHKKILLLWYMEDDNFGDVLIYDTVSSHLIEKGYVVESHEVGDSSVRIIEHANQCDFMLFAGGGIIERWIPESIRLFKKNFEKLKVPYGVIGFGMGNFDYSECNEVLKFWVEHADFFYVRDEATQKQLNTISDSKKVIFSADCVFLNKNIEKYNHKEQHNTKVGKGVNLRDIPYKDLTGDFDWEEINLVLKQVNCDIVIPDSSKEISNILVGERRKPEEMEFLLPIEKARKTIDEINKCQWIIAMRFHVVLVAALLGIPTIPILYSPKVKYIAEQLGIYELALEINEFSDIPKKINMLTNEREKYLNTIKKNVGLMKEKADTMFEDVFRFLEEQ